MQQQQQQQQQSPTPIHGPGSQPVNVHYVVAAQPPKPTVYSQFPKKSAVGVGITLIVAGLLSIIFNVVEIAVGVTEANKNYYYNLTWLFGFIGHGFWVGILSIVPGGIGIGAGIHKTRKRICAFNVMCVIAASFATVQFCIGLSGAIAGADCYYYNYGYYVGECDVISETALAMEVLLTILAVVEAIAAIYGSVLCCRTYCCCSCCETTPQPSVMPYVTPVAFISGNQQVQYPVTTQGYQNVAYQPGYPAYPGQPLQFTMLPPAYSLQGQFIPAEQPPNYPGAGQNVQMNYPSMVGVQVYSTSAEPVQATVATVHRQQNIQSQSDQHLDSSGKVK